MANAIWPLPDCQCHMTNAKWRIPDGQYQMTNGKSPHGQMANSKSVCVRVPCVLFVLSVRISCHVLPVSRVSVCSMCVRCMSFVSHVTMRSVPSPPLVYPSSAPIPHSSRSLILKRLRNMPSPFFFFGKPSAGKNGQQENHELWLCVITQRNARVIYSYI